MEQQEIKQWLINFVVKTLNGCKAYTDVYGKSFTRQRLNMNLKRVYTDTYIKHILGTYDSEKLNMQISKRDEHSSPLTIAEIENSRRLQETILHESIHAVFNRTKKECKTFGIKGGTGVVEFYHNNSILGKGLNEGLTEWICEKAGYKAQCYKQEVGFVKMLELAIGEQAVMKFAKGNIRGNIAKLLHMSKDECIQLLSFADSTYKAKREMEQIDRIAAKLSPRRGKTLKEEDYTKLKAELGEDYSKYFLMMLDMEAVISDNKQKLENLPSKDIKISGNDVDTQVAYLRHMFKKQGKILSEATIRFENAVFERYFKKEIEEAQRTKRLSGKTMKRMEQLHSMIQSDGNADENFTLPLKFKNEIYKELKEKYRGRTPEEKRTNLPVPQKQSWIQKFKETIILRLTKKPNQETPNIAPVKTKAIRQPQGFREHISDMSNYSKQSEKKDNVGEIDLQNRQRNVDTQDEPEL